MAKRCKYSFFLCVCVCVFYLPMVLGSEVSWLSSTLSVVSFFNIPTNKHNNNTHIWSDWFQCSVTIGGK